MTAIQQKLAAIFQGEHAEHLEHIRSILGLLEHVAETKGRAEIDEAFRRAHSLKGAARAVDLETVEGLASGLETLFSRVRQGTMRLDQKTARVIHQILDASEQCVGAFRENRVPEDPAAALLAIDDVLGIESRAKKELVTVPVKTLPEATVPEAGAQPTPILCVCPPRIWIGWYGRRARCSRRASGKPASPTKSMRSKTISARWNWNASGFARHRRRCDGAWQINRGTPL